MRPSSSRLVGGGEGEEEEERVSLIVRPAVRDGEDADGEEEDALDARYDLLDRAIEEVGMGPFQYFSLFITGLGTFIDASETALLSLLFPLLKQAWNCSYDELALIGSVTSLGMMVGGPLFGYLSDLYGRRVVYMISLSLVTAFGLISSFMTDVASFAAVRFLLGMAYGGNSISGITLMLETMPHNQRSFATSVHAFSWGLGALFITGVGLASSTIGWEWLVRIPSLVALPILISMCWVPESTRYYLSRDNHDMAMDSLRQMAARNKKPIPTFFTKERLDEMLERRQKTLERRRAKALGVKERITTTSSSSSSPTPGARSRALCNCKRDCGAKCANLCRKMRRTFSVARHSGLLKMLVPLTIVWFLTSCGSTVFAWIPIAVATADDVTNSTSTNSTGFVIKNDVPYYTSFLMAAGNLTGCVLLYFISSRFSRTILMRWGLLFCSIFTFVMSDTTASTAAILAMSFFLVLSYQVAINMLYLYTPEVLPTALRTTLFGVCIFANRLAHVISPFLVSYLATVSSFSKAVFVFGFFFVGALLVSAALNTNTFNVPMIEEAHYYGDEGMGDDDEEEEEEENDGGEEEGGRKMG